MASHTSAEQSGSHPARSPRRFHFDEGTNMPYEWPRGAETGSRRGLRVAVVLCVLLTALFFASVVYMAKGRWTRTDNGRTEATPTQHLFR